MDYGLKMTKYEFKYGLKAKIWTKYWWKIADFSHYKDPSTLQFIILNTITDISRFYTVIFKDFIEFLVDFR
jgi:hypothetical protein